MNRLSNRLLLPGIVFLMAVVLGPSAAPVMAQGRWQTLPYTMPINPIHVALLRTGKVLVVSGSGNKTPNTNYQAALWDPQAGTITTQPVGYDMFCNGIVVLPDGRPFVMGGTLQYDPFHGELRTSSYDPLTNILTDQQSMAHGRWYPTGTVLGDGRVMVFSGLNETGSTNTSVEFYSASSGWSAAFSAPWTPPLYPRMHLLPNGNVFYSGSTTGSSLFNPATHTWTTNIAFTNYSGTRTYGSSVLLPLTPANNYTPKVMIMGGGNPSTATTELIDLSAPTPKWVYGPSMSQPRIEMDATILPSGQVLALGGSLNDEDTTTASLNADLYDPASNTFSSAGAEVYARLYHSVSLLLPDATVWVAGSNPQRGTYELHMEIYSPRYLFNADGSPATRPTITGTSSSVIGYGSAFQVQTPDAANISSVVLMRNGASTHAFDMDQRYVGLSFTPGAGVLNVAGPPNGNIAPPGYYMLFILNASGVPSVASMVQVSAAANDVPPTGTITSPASNVTISAGQFVSYSGTGSDPDGTISAYSWSFSGGNPSSSNLANPGSITYATQGTYVTTFTVTDNAGLTDPNPPTRTITVLSDFSLSASPSSQTVVQGGSTSFTTTVTPGTGFSGTVSLNVSGLPVGATASFSPASISISGSSTLSVSTSSSTATGSYPLTVTATSGSLTHTANVTLVVMATSGGTGIALVQHTSLDSSGTSATLAFNSNNTAGNWIGVCIRAGALNEVFTVTDSRRNTYHKAVQFNQNTDGFTFGIYYAENIGGGANTVMVADTVSGTLRVALLEYSGVAASGSLDVIAMGQGHSSSPSSSPSVNTTANGELLLGAVMTGNPEIFTGVPGYQIEESAPAEPGTKLIAEDQIQAIAGPVTVAASLGAADDWAAGLAAFKAAGSGPPTVATPTFSPGAGTYTSAQTVTISSATSGATICYTANGTTPAANTPGTCSTGTTLANGGTVTVGVSETLQAIGTKSGLTNSAVGSASYTISTCVQNLAIGNFTLCGESYNDVSNGANVQVNYSPSPSNGIIAWATWCFNSSCKSSISGVTATIGDNINATESCFVASPHSPFITNANGGAEGSGDFQQHYVWYCPSIPSGVTSFTVTPSNPNLSFVQLNISEWKAGSLATSCSPISACFEDVDNLGQAGNSTGGTTATITSSGSTVNANDLVFAVTEVPCCSFTASPGTGYTGITVAPSVTPGMVSEAKAATATGIQTATTTWTGGSTPWFGVIVPLKGAGAAPVVATPTFNPGAGTYSSSQTVTISSTTSGATICYTTNGTPPAANTPGTCSTGTTLANGGTVTVSASETLEAIGTESGLANSGVASAAYVITVATPSITSLNPTSGPVGASVTITGTNFGSTGTVTFGGTTATVTSWSATSIATSVPTGVPTGNVNVVVKVGAVASNGVNFTVTSGGTGIALVQHTSLDSSGTSATLAFNLNNTAGNWIGVCIRAGAVNESFAVKDSSGNTYHKAIQFSETLDGNSFGVYYAENIGGGANAVTVSDTTSATLRFAILEYSGIATSGSLDGTAVAQGNSASANSGNATTTANGDLLLGAIMTANPATFTAGPGYKIEESVPAEPGTKLIAEDQIQTTAGAASASASLGAADIWAAGVAAFKPAKLM